MQPWAWVSVQTPEPDRLSRRRAVVTRSPESREVWLEIKLLEYYSAVGTIAQELPDMPQSDGHPQTKAVD